MTGVGTNSFVGGQFWAEMLAIGMKKGLAFVNLWSVTEGSNPTSNIGYIEVATGNKKSTYHHFKMMSENFKGAYVNGTNNVANVKSFGSKDGNQIAVMILNQDQSSNFSYTVRLNDNTVSGSNALKINISAGVDKEFTGSIDNQSSTLLVFDLSGNLVKKIEYKMNGMASLNIPPVTTLFAATVGTTKGTVLTGAKEVNNGELAALETRVYPNPSTGAFTVKMNVANGVNENITMEVVNTIGQVVYSVKPVVQNGYINEKIDLNSNLASGLYIVQTKIGDTSFNTKMLITK